ncbi:MAG: [Ni/Fe] hydrogenase small subunit [Bacteroidetes bacterium 24-39-8]|jgi:hydrogenase small subunit|nr:MAG: [Ni/Fe] hydrogenase small subunit [Sphingobacteriia bacterium 35-40-8]OYZ51908.1 MAG: [Ni/Fe] hydrogenase small subunit [Bacteroidetes bacterium 24-39-8]OZA64074.1 MAG: [Ni/Fe] hydrogenase small subunit [Sphingobacteriia bacterium 39-39-8]HQR94271.1 hydrogenase small subunit [Sediminibacterium sp.]HQS55152.1 hydrogenase small subunit [Sediminibacterium sp.]
MSNELVPTKQPTYYEEVERKGYSRRDFLQFVSMMTAFIGLENSAIGQVAKALETKPRVPVIWLHFQECTCCSESFIRSSHPIVADILLDKISLDYTETLMAASGFQAEEAMQNTMKKYKGEYILCVEGSVPMGADGVYCMIGGKTSLQILEEAAEGAKAIIAWGSCASNGCVQAAKPNPTQATPIHKLVKGKPVIKVPGCPPIGEVMAGVIVHLVTFDRIPELDGLGRPKAFYSKRVHDTCYRRPFYDAGLYVESFDDANARKGYCLYKVGCKGPSTYNACGVMKWNNGTSFPIQSGHGCIGCSEENYWDNGRLYDRASSFAGFGIEANADTFGKVALGVTGAALAGHAVMTNVKKKKLIRNLEDEGKQSEHELKS